MEKNHRMIILRVMVLSPWAGPRGLAHPQTFSEHIWLKMGEKSMNFSISPK
jgi:hypothetical protein